MQCDTQFDMICVDVFLDVHIPEIFLTKDFLEALQECLSEKGIILFNHLALKPEEITAANTYFEDIFVKIFDQGIALNVKGNIMMISDDRVML